jgi:hypothetical protein
MKIRQHLLVACLLGLAASAAAQSSLYFRIGYRDGSVSDPAEEFIVKTADPDLIAACNAELDLPEADRSLYVAGLVSRDTPDGDWNFNGLWEPWPWRLLDGNWSLTYADEGPCDTSPSQIGDLELFCPSLSYVKGITAVIAEFVDVYGERRGQDVFVLWMNSVIFDSVHFEVQFATAAAPTVFTTAETVNPNFGFDYSLTVPDQPDARYLRILAATSAGRWVVSDVVDLGPAGAEPTDWGRLKAMYR